MYNNILRKVTSLSLLTILLLSTAAFALPNAMPAAHAQVASHPNLFVSAENSQYNNYFAGPQVIQVVVSDPNINRIDQQYGEPIVTIGGKRLRMAQGTDGNWYGYFADRNQAEIAGKTAPVGGQGLNFGYFCGPTSNAAGLRSGWTMTDTKGFTVARNPFNGALLGNASETNVAGTVNPISPFGITTVGTLNNVCTFTSNSYAANTDTASVQNVVRENKTLNGGGAGFAASTNLQAAWPVIQLYDFSGIPQTVVVDYSAAGGDQIVNLTFDRIPSNLITVTPDRTSYPENTQVFLTMNDPQLNVDPTEDDVWTWGANANNNTLYYQAFDRNANARADGITGGVGGATLMPSAPAASPAMQNLIGNLTSFNFNHNGKFTFNPTAQGVRVVDFQNFGREKLVCNSGLANQCNSGTRGTPLQVQDNGLNLAKGSEMITFAEQGGVNTGVFGDWDGARIAGIVTLSPSEESPPTGSAYPAQGSIRGQSATFKYNDISGSIVGGFAFGSITMTATNGTWASGQRIPVTLTDMDQNRNSKLTEHLNDYDSNVLRISTMKLGTPFSLNAGCPTCLTGASDPTSLSPNFNLVAGGHIGTAGNGLIQLTPPAPGDTTHVVPGVSFAGFTSFTSLTSATDPDLGVDEQFSNRVLPAFSGPTALLTLQSGGGILVDTGGTMQQLLNTINDPRGGNAAGGANPVTRFHGFNFLNFDLRSFTSLNGATGTPISSVNIYLIHGPANNVRNPVTGATTFYNLVGGAAPSLANLGNGVVGFSLVNDTNLEDFVNLNGTQPVPANLLASHGETAFANDFYTPGVIDSGSVVNGRIFQAATQSPNDVVGFLYVFTIPGVGNTLTLPNFPIGGGASETTGIPMVTDFFSIGIVGDGTDNTQRINNGVYRWELEETGDNTGVFTGTTQFLMLNQVNILDPATYSQLRTINHDVLFPAIQDMLQSEARAPQITYFDLGADGVNVQVSAQQDIPTHSGTVSFDQKTYKVGDTVTVTVNDPDLNTNNDLVVIYNTVAPATGGAPIDPATDTVGKSGLGLYSNGQAIGRMLDIQFGQQDIRWTNTVIPGIAGTATCPTFTGGLTPLGAPGGFAATGFTLVETAAGSGIFTGTFEIPDQICQNLSGTIQGVVANGQNMKVNYVDFRDESGKLVEISDNAGIRGNTGSVKLDKSVYPVPFGTVGATAGTASFNPATVQGKASQSGVFPLHRDVSGTGLISTNVLPQGKVLVHTRVNDPDYTTAATGTNFINVGVMGTLVGTQTSLTHGPVAFQISRSGQSVLLATAGGPTKTPGHIIDIGAAQLPPQNSPTWNSVPDLGPMQEITPGAGIFQTDLPIELTDGPAPV
ncbi:MAG: hypothetical protein KGI08_04810, partial [Thaumarchaeota archaeon]|nr:hypothetical protein [Nitrososphaerota archaeon]